MLALVLNGSWIENTCQIEGIEKRKDKPTPSQNAKCDRDRGTPLETERQMAEQSCETTDEKRIRIATVGGRKPEVPPEIDGKQAKNDNQYAVTIEGMRW